MKNFVPTLVILLTATILAIGIGEFSLRQVFPLPLSSPSPQVRYDLHPTRRFTLRPDQQAFTYSAPVRVGPDGFRVTPGTESPHQDSVNVVALGDSFTFGMGVADHETWPARLQSHLSSGGVERYRVINMGTISYGVQQELDLFVERGLNSRPRVVVHGLYWNDYMDAGPVGPNAAPALTSDGYFVWDPPTPQGGLGRLKAFVRDHSVLAFVSMQVLKSALAEQGTSHYETHYQSLVRGEIAPGLFEPVEAFYRELKSLGSRNGFDMYVIVFPVFGIVEAGNPENHPYSRVIREMFRRLDIPYLDGLALWRERGLGVDTYLPYNRHLGPNGHDIVAAAAAEDLRELMTPGDATPAESRQSD